MAGLTEEIGRYRSGGVGIISGNSVVHVAPPATQVPRLMAQLFAWLNTTEHPALIAGAVFHYEFEFIHPFADGNGRMGRLWQSLILARWNPLFANLPVESLVHASQSGYYQAIAESTQATDCAPFVEFMLETIHDTLVQSRTQSWLGNDLGKGLGKELSRLQESILKLLQAEPRITIKTLATRLAVSTTSMENNPKNLSWTQRVCCSESAWLGATTRNGHSIPRSCNNARRAQSSAICRVAHSPIWRGSKRYKYHLFSCPYLAV